MNELDINLVHIRGDTMPADALSRQPMIEVAQQARRETRQAEATATLEVRPAFPLTMSDQQWKFEQKRDTTCREVRAFVEDKRLSLTLEISNIIELYGHHPTPSNELQRNSAGEH